MKKFISTIVVVLTLTGGGYFLFNIINQDNGLEGIEFDNQNLEVSDQEQSAQPTEQELYGGMTKEEFWSQLRAEILQPGEGQAAENGNTLTVHYIGYLEDGTKFDSSVDRGQPFQVVLGAGQVIQGWDLGLVGIKVGEIRRLFIPSAYGYGEQGAGNGAIPPNANLIFEVQLLEIQ